MLTLACHQVDMFLKMKQVFLVVSDLLKNQEIVVVPEAPLLFFLGKAAPVAKACLESWKAVASVWFGKFEKTLSITLLQGQI